MPSPASHSRWAVCFAVGPAFSTTSRGPVAASVSAISLSLWRGLSRMFEASRAQPHELSIRPAMSWSATLLAPSGTRRHQEYIMRAARMAGPAFFAVALLPWASPAGAQTMSHAAVRERPGTALETVASSGLREAISRPLDVRQEPSSKPERHRDSILDGLLIGAGIGALLGLIPDHYDDCEECHDSLYGSIAVGAGVGALVDFLRTGKPAPSPVVAHGPLRVDVALGKRRTGITATIHWR